MSFFHLQEREFGNAEGLELLRKSLKSIRQTACGVSTTGDTDSSPDPDADQVRKIIQKNLVPLPSTREYFLRDKTEGISLKAAKNYPSDEVSTSRHFRLQLNYGV